MERYETYKSSGVEWIGSIPEHWQIKKLKFLIAEKLKYGANESAESEDIEQPRYIRITDFGDDGKLRDSTFKSLAYETAKDYLLNDGDILFARSGATVGKTFQFKNYEGLACFAGYLIKASPDNSQILSDFLNYFTKSHNYENWKNSIFNQATIQNIGADKYNFLEVPLTTIEEQSAIVKYLDEKTEQIDKLIVNKRRLIELLKEERTAIINQAVTKGINESAELKSSGIDWLGDIPDNWQIKKLKSIAYMKGRIGWQNLRASEFSFDSIQPYLITGMNFKKGIINWEEVYHITEDRYDEAPEIQLKEGDVLMTKDGTIGKLLFVDSIPYPHKASLNSHLLVFRPKTGDFKPKYLYYQLDSTPFKNHIELTKTGTTFYGISQEATGEYRMLLPPIEEQDGIVQFIEARTKEVDLTISKVEKEIELMLEYRTALISEVITGKIKVV